MFWLSHLTSISFLIIFPMKNTIHLVISNMFAESEKRMQKVSKLRIPMSIFAMLIFENCQTLKMLTWPNVFSHCHVMHVSMRLSGDFDMRNPSYVKWMSYFNRYTWRTIYKNHKTNLYFVIYLLFTISKINKLWHGVNLHLLVLKINEYNKVLLNYLFLIPLFSKDVSFYCNWRIEKASKTFFNVIC